MTGGDDILHVDFGDGLQALDRVMRTITMMISEAIGQLQEMGWERDLDRVHITGIDLAENSDPVDDPIWGITVKGHQVFTVKFQRAPTLAVQGHWENGWPRAPSFLVMWWRSRARS